MKRFIAIISAVVVLFLVWDCAYYRLGWYIDFATDKEVEVFVKTQGKNICIRSGGVYKPFEIKGVNMGSGKPGKWSMDFAIDKDTYKRWFEEIRDMGANTIRVYTIQSPAFYNAFYEYNEDNPAPLYMIHGVWVNDYIQNSHRDAYDKSFFDTFMRDCKTMLDVIHGRKKLALGGAESAGHGSYSKDVSQWVIGYILGVEWEEVTVAYTDEKYKGEEWYSSFSGEYMYTDYNASPFETLLARVGDKFIEYETKKYKTQKPVAFSNWPTTDPFKYSEGVTELFMKCARIDVEHIKTTDAFEAGQFASYHVYPYFPDYLNFEADRAALGLSDDDFIDDNGRANTYRAYLNMLTAHHTMPVLISEFGVSTGRGMAHRDINTNRNQGHMSEKEQGQALVECYKDIMSAGCAGGCIFSWQDEWFKRTWNTMYAVDLTQNPYWSDYQTNEQYFGLLSFDPGEDKSICYVDGDVSEWNDSEIIAANDDMSVSAKYDERFVYFLVNKKDFDFERDKLYIPIDTTQKSGTNYCRNFKIKFDRNADFIIALNGRENSRLVVQERYDSMRSTYSQNMLGFDTYITGNIPDVNTPDFVNINMLLDVFDLTDEEKERMHINIGAETIETGKLRYGNANPESEEFDSLADFCVTGDYIEIKLPWQLLNFADPSQMQIHDDYYNGNYGVRHINIDKMYIGITDGKTDRRCELKPIKLKPWGHKVTYHERLKSSYYVMQSFWKNGG